MMLSRAEMWKSSVAGSGPKSGIGSKSLQGKVYVGLARRELEMGW